MPRRRKDDDVLGELDAIAQGVHPSQKSILEEYRQCPDWQLATRLIAQAVREFEHGGGRSRALEPPPAWLPPIL